jgi:hypothetical protein
MGPNKLEGFSSQVLYLRVRPGLLALPKNITLYRKGLPGTNAIAHLLPVKSKKKFYYIDTCTYVIKIFFFTDHGEIS